MDFGGVENIPITPDTISQTDRINPTITPGIAINGITLSLVPSNNSKTQTGIRPSTFINQRRPAPHVDFHVGSRATLSVTQGSCRLPFVREN
jgi:hypothetical protein